MTKERYYKEDGKWYLIPRETYPIIDEFKELQKKLRNWKEPKRKRTQVKSWEKPDAIYEELLAYRATVERENT